MKSLLSCLQFSVGHHRSPSQQDDEPHNTSNGEVATRPASSEAPAPGQRSEAIQENMMGHGDLGEGANRILVPQPRKPNTAVWSYWMNYMRMSSALVSNLPGMRSSSSESGDSGVKSDGACQQPEGPYPRKLSKDERAEKVQRYLEKKKRKSGAKKIRYQYRQQLAARRIRYQGRFVKASEAKDLIMQGAPVTARDKTDLNKLFEEDKNQDLFKKYEDNIRLRSIKPIFRTIHDTSVVERLRSESAGSSGGSLEGSCGSGMSPLIETMKDINLGAGFDAQTAAKIALDPPPILKL